MIKIGTRVKIAGGSVCSGRTGIVESQSSDRAWEVNLDDGWEHDAFNLPFFANELVPIDEVIESGNH